MAQASAERTEGWGRSLGAEAPLLSSSGRSNHFLHSGYVCSLRVPPPGGAQGFPPHPAFQGGPLPESYYLPRAAPVPCPLSHSPGSTFLMNQQATDHAPGARGAVAGAVDAQMGRDDGQSHTAREMLTFACGMCQR